MKSTKREPGGELGVLLASDLVLSVNPRVTFRWSPRSADVDNRTRHISGTSDESVGLSTLRTEERTLLALADGRRSIDDLARLAGMPILVAVRVLRSLYDRGILVPADQASASDSANAPTNAPTLAPTNAPTNAPTIAPTNSPNASANAPPNTSTNAPAPASSGWPSEISPPRILTEALGDDSAGDYDHRGPVDDRGPRVMTEPTAPRGTESAPALVTAPGGSVAVEASDGSSSSLRGVVANASPLTATDDRSSSSKKPASGPNVTLFWIPSSPPESSSPAPAAQNAGASEPVAPLSHRKNTPDATVVVMGSPPVSSSAPAERFDAGWDAPLTATNPPSSAIPFRVGAYEVATRIAQGAMGSIYVCRRVGAGGFQRLFTLKVIRQHSTQKEMAIKSFTREARIGALLHHPNVQTLVDVGSYEDQPFLILDYVEGTSLSELLGDDRRAPAPVVIAIILDLLRGLQHVHEIVDGQGARLGLVHGDVSPQNVLIGVDGAARLTDFGSARFAKEEQATGGDSVAVGKPAYMAPEQLRGEATDARTDLFSVGILMWTALTGQKLFAADTYDQTVMRVMRRKVPPPSEFGAPACLDPVILKALSRAREGRYATADEMSRDIAKAAATENLIASPRDVELWVRRELGDALADRRRKIQEMFGGTPRPEVTNDAPPAPRQRRNPPKTADGFERLPARTVQIGAVGLGWAAANRPPKRRRAKSAPRSQWVVVIGSAVVAACALAVAIAYFVSSMMTPQKRPTRKMPTAASTGAADVSAAGSPAAAVAPAAVPPPVDPAAKSVDQPVLRSDTPPGR